MPFHEDAVPAQGLGLGNEVESLLYHSHLVLSDSDDSLLIVVFVAQLVGEIESEKVLDTVLHHVADHKDDEERPM